jgi:hypothetical protein
MEIIITYEGPPDLTLDRKIQEALEGIGAQWAVKSVDQGKTTMSFNLRHESDPLPSGTSRGCLSDFDLSNTIISDAQSGG